MHAVVLSKCTNRQRDLSYIRDEPQKSWTNTHAKYMISIPYIRDGTSTIREPTRCVKGPDAPLMDGTSKNREPTRSSVRQRARSGSARTTHVQQCGAVPSTGNINITRVEVERGSGSQHARTGEMYCIVSRQKGLPPPSPSSLPDTCPFIRTSLAALG